jgi:hypothetical protein
MHSSFALTLTGPFGDEMFVWSPDGTLQYPSDRLCRLVAAEMLEAAAKALAAAPQRFPEFAGGPLDEPDHPPGVSDVQPVAPAPSPLAKLRAAGIAKAKAEGWGFVLVDPPQDMICRAAATLQCIPTPREFRRVQKLSDHVPVGDNPNPRLIGRLLRAMDRIEHRIILRNIPRSCRSELGIAALAADDDHDRPLFLLGLSRPSRAHPCLIDMMPQAIDNNILLFQRQARLL